MNYEQFRAAWYAALAQAGMTSHLAPPAETVELGGMSRTYHVYVHLANPGKFDPFHVSAGLSWTWDALQAARTATSEEDALMELLGADGRRLDTERPWLTVKVTLSATLPWRFPLPLPDPVVWRAWLADVTGRLEPLLPIVLERRDEWSVAFAHRSEPEAEVQPAAGGQLYLTRVKLSPWQVIHLPRQWDDPKRQEDEDPYQQLARFRRAGVAGVGRVESEPVQACAPWRPTALGNSAPGSGSRGGAHPAV